MEKQILVSESYNNMYERGKHFVGVSMWHFEWCTKYRYKMMTKFEYNNLVKGCIRRAASEHKIKIIELEVMPEHIHLVAGLPGTMSPSKAMQLLKGRSSYLFFKMHPKARLRYPKGHFWSRGKFWASLRFIQVDQAREYVKNQLEHHRNSTL
ncbi:IS200/IS605 family transposase [Candidatus Pacearchaeota archaeon]|nr:IS200/IS605 family transposase [Candidatus Pacearchaeota archaeon]